MVRTDEIRGFMAKKKISGVKMAQIIGIKPKTFYLKMKNGKFSTDEAKLIVDALEIADPASIFFADE